MSLTETFNTERGEHNGVVASEDERLEIEPVLEFVLFDGGCLLRVVLNGLKVGIFNDGDHTARLVLLASFMSGNDLVNVTLCFVRSNNLDIDLDIPKFLCNNVLVDMYFNNFVSHKAMQVAVRNTSLLITAP